jgi:hypothetical protein
MNAGTPAVAPSVESLAAAEVERQLIDEIAHTNPLWLHPGDAARLGVGTGDLVREAYRLPGWTPLGA